jgi:hypothetical protein
MDVMTEVNWSQICRNAISQYITTRQNPKPLIEIDLQYSRLEEQSHRSGYPSLFLSLRIHNKMDFRITLDRLLMSAEFRKDNHIYWVGSNNDLYRHAIEPYTTITKQTHITIFKEKILDLRDVFQSTFHGSIRCIAFVDDFAQPYSRELRTRIPIDDWQQLIETQRVKSNG